MNNDKKADQHGQERRSDNVGENHHDQIAGRRDTRIKKGERRNPKGRPKSQRQRLCKDTLLNHGMQKLPVKGANGKTTYQRRIEIVQNAVFVAAARKDISAARFYFEICGSVDSVRFTAMDLDRLERECEEAARYEERGEVEDNYLWPDKAAKTKGERAESYGPNRTTTNEDGFAPELRKFFELDKAELEQEEELWVRICDAAPDEKAELYAQLPSRRYSSDDVGAKASPPFGTTNERVVGISGARDGTAHTPHDGNPLDRGHRTGQEPSEQGRERGMTSCDGQPRQPKERTWDDLTEWEKGSIEFMHLDPDEKG